MPIFEFLAERGGLSASDMEHTFNNGLGMVAVVPAEGAAAAAEAVGGYIVGRVTDREGVSIQ